MHGTVSGGINGRSVDLTINWDNGSKGRYVGQVIDEPGKAATGTTGDSGWYLLGPLQCLTPNNPLPPAPAQQPAPAQPPASGYPLATVTADNDVYNVPNDPPGTGHKIGMLHAGEQRQIVQLRIGKQGGCSPQGWNHLVTPDMPGGTPEGTGFAWGFISCP
jgi:hypothetical protein